jgi:hypothetical protein
VDEEIAVFCGQDVGKSEHHATALDRSGERIFDKPLPQDEARLRELFTGLQQHGRVLVIVDQPNTIGALPIAVARDCGATVAYLPGLAMRKAADLYPGKSKTDVLTELTGPTTGNRMRCGSASARFCSHGQRRAHAAGTVRSGGAAVGLAGDHRQPLRTVSAG